MKIVCLNGSPNAGSLDEYLEKLDAELTRSGHEIERFDLRSLNLPRCTGCFGCWVKTPGECVSKDASHEISRAVIHADLVLFASPLIMGFTSALLKTATDKLIQLLHPYVTFVQNEMHHAPRYSRYPAWGVIAAPEADTDDEDLAIVRRIYERAALNFKTDLRFMAVSTQSVEEVAHEFAAH